MPPVYSFGEFQLDASKKRLTRGRSAVALTEHQTDVLLHLVSHAGEIIPKNVLIDAAWPGVAVTDNSLEQAISALRKSLGDGRSGPKLIETVARRGYRFRGDVTRTEPRASDAELAAILEPHRAWVEGRAALETLERDAVERAARVFAQVVAQAPGQAPAHVGLANACVMQYESTRADARSDEEALRRAGHHAREACRIDPQSAEAWAALALVLHRSGLGVQAIAAARRAVMLEPANWRHHLRLGFVAWGEERLRAAQHALDLFPGFALAHWLAATVYVARRAFDRAEQELRSGSAAQDRQRDTHVFSSVGCHWLLGLVRFAVGDERQALEALARELSFETSGQLYARECVANTWYAIGAVRLRQGQPAEAASAFGQALERVPLHVLSMVGLSVALNPGPSREAIHARIEERLQQMDEAGLLVDAAVGRAARACLASRPEEASMILDSALAAAPAGNAGWLVPIDPLLNAAAHEAAFARVLARLRTRAG